MIARPSIQYYTMYDIYMCILAFNEGCQDMQKNEQRTSLIRPMRPFANIVKLHQVSYTSLPLWRDFLST